MTGYIVDSEEEALAALSNIEQIDRRTVRAVFERRFAARTMARSYVDLYARLLTQPHRCCARPDASTRDA